MTSTVRAFGPGRVNLLGEHTDYNGGLALPFAIADGVTVVATSSEDGRISAHAADLDEHDDFPATAPTPAPGWRAFVRGTVAELRAAGHDPPAARLHIAGTVPRGSGLASSAALEVALAIALLGREPDDPIALARLCSRVENDWVGARTGLLDQLASLLGREGHALRIDFATLAVEHVPLRLGGWQLVTLDSGERHRHATSGYNVRRAECERAAAALGVATVSEADPEAAAALPDPLDRRVLHVLTENARVEQAVAALRADDLPALGALLLASHASLRDRYDASTPAVERTVRALLDAGAVGARMVGGGFGGHVLALMAPGAPPPPGARAVEPGRGGGLV